MRATTIDYGLVVGAYVAWGVLPIFWALLAGVDSLTVLYQRTVWSSLFLGLWLLLRGDLRSTLLSLKVGQVAKATALSSLFLAINWFSYLYALQHKEFLATSTAYYLCPIMSVVVSAWVMGERVSLARRAALVVMVCGALLPACLEGKMPWLAFVIGGSWCGYTAVRKWFAVSSVAGLFLETTALGALLTLALPMTVGAETFVGNEASLWSSFLFPLAGIVTALPILALVEGMQGVPFGAIGVLQYLVPSLMLLTSMTYFHTEPTFAQGISLGVIGFGIILYLAGNYSRNSALS